MEGTDVIGVVAFDGAPQVFVPVQQVGNDANRQRIREMLADWKAPAAPTSTRRLPRRWT